MSELIFLLIGVVLGFGLGIGFAIWFGTWKGNQLRRKGGMRIDVWAFVGPNRRQRMQAWYDPTRSGWVLDEPNPATATEGQSNAS